MHDVTKPHPDPAFFLGADLALHSSKHVNSTPTEDTDICGDVAHSVHSTVLKACDIVLEYGAATTAAEAAQLGILLKHSCIVRI